MYIVPEGQVWMYPWVVWKAIAWLMSLNILDYTEDEKALKGTCDCSQGKFLSFSVDL